MFDVLTSDVRYSLRALGRRPLFLATAVLSLAVGGGLNAGVYVLLREVLFATPRHVPEPQRLVRIQPGLSYPNYLDLRRQRLGMDLAAMQMTTLTSTGNGVARSLSAHVVSDNFFDTLGVKPFVGRTFRSDDVRGHDVVVLGFMFWQTEFGSDVTVVGRTMTLNGVSHVVLGVLPSGFSANPLMSGVVHVPIGSSVATALDNRRAAQFDVIARLDTGVQLAEARAAMRSAVEQLEHSFPEINRGLARETLVIATDIAGILWQAPTGRLLLAAAVTSYALVGLVLLIGCANVAGLMMTRVEARRREMAVRVALGAGRWRLAQLPLLESFIVGTLGCALGLICAHVFRVVLYHRLSQSAAIDVVALSASTPLLYSVLLVCVVTAASGGLSAARTASFARTAVAPSLQGRVSRRLRGLRALVAAQIAISFVLLAAAAGMLRSVVRLHVANPGFATERLLSVDVQTPRPAPRRDLMSIGDALETEVNIEAVTWGTPLGPPITEGLRWTGGSGDAIIRADLRVVGPRFFETLRIPVTRGRSLINADFTSAGIEKHVVVNAMFVRQVVSGLDPLGARLVRSANPDSGRPQQSLRIVGVAEDTLARAIGEGVVPVVYVPEQSPTLMIRVATDSATAVQEVAEAVARLEPPGSVITARRFADVLAAASAPIVTAARVTVCLAGLALLLATAGLYAIVNYVAMQRRPELGIRLALGASQRTVVTMILGDGMHMAIIGCVCGAAASWMLGRALQSLVVGQTVVTWSTLATVGVLLLLVCSMAALVPARRAARSDPLTTLRQE